MKKNTTNFKLPKLHIDKKSIRLLQPRLMEVVNGGMPKQTGQDCGEGPF